MTLTELRRHADELSTLIGVTVDLQEDGTQVFVILRSLPLPCGAYRVTVTDVLFITDAQYPLSAMDMFWTDVDVLRNAASFLGQRSTSGRPRGVRADRETWPLAVSRQFFGRRPTANAGGMPPPARPLPITPVPGKVSS